MGGDDQVMGAARGTGPADMSEEAPVMGCRGLSVIKDVNGRGDRSECPGPLGRPVSRISQLDPDAVLGDRDGCDSEFVLI
jgi:hypothetical protein